MPVGAQDHSLVLRHPPIRRHRVLFPERVDALVRQRHVALHLQLEPAGAALLAGDAVQVALEVVERQQRGRVAQVGRPAGGDGQRHGHVDVADRRVRGHDVVGVLHVEGPEVTERAEGHLEEVVPHVRAREDDGRRRAWRLRGVAARWCVEAVGDDVDGVEGGEGGPEAVPGDGDAGYLVLVQLHQTLHLLKNLHAFDSVNGCWSIYRINFLCKTHIDEKIRDIQNDVKPEV